MADLDARPPPGVCGRIKEIVGGTDPHTVREFAHAKPPLFEQLLHHAGDCRMCRQLIDDAFPEGFVTLEESKFNQAGLDKAEQLLRNERVEMGRGSNDPGDGNLGT